MIRIPWLGNGVSILSWTRPREKLWDWLVWRWGGNDEWVGESGNESQLFEFMLSFFVLDLWALEEFKY